MQHVIEVAGPQHVGIGLDLVGGRSGVSRASSGYPQPLEALAGSVDAQDCNLVAAENWLRILADVL